MSWRDILKESMARDLSEQYGRDYIDTLIGSADDDYEKAVAESVAYLINNKLVTKDSNSFEIEELLEKHKNDIQVPVYGGKMDLSLDEMFSEYLSLAESVSREVGKILTPKR
jgi:hypothetical protein